MHRGGLSDTSREAEQVLAQAYRAMSPSRKWSLMADMYRFGRGLHADGLRARSPGVTDRDVRADWIATHIGTDVPVFNAPEASIMDQPIENQRVLEDVIAAFNRLGIPHALGGSLASGIYGYTRLTADADLSVEPFAGREAELVAQFGPEYYISSDAISQAIRDRSSFNIINTFVGFKVDVFIRKERAFDRSMMARRRRFDRPDRPEPPIDLVSPEDIILLKLEWYRLGGEISDRQWNDILGVLRTRAGQLDDAYLDHWSAELGVQDLLTQAREDAIL